MVTMAPDRGSPRNRRRADPPNNYGRQPYGRAPPPPDADQYQDEHDLHGQPNGQDGGQDRGQDGGYEHDPYHPNNQHLADEEEEFYDDGPPPRRRIGVMAIAVVFALAVVGTAGAFGYRAMFGSSGSSLPPPVIKADTAPSKIVPATASAQPNKLINDRVNERGQGERLVSREEQPVDIKDKASGSMVPNAPDNAQSRLGSGIVGSEPKKVRTIAIRPDTLASADATPASAPPLAATRVTNAAPAKQAAPALAPAPPRVVSAPPPAADPEPAPPPAMRVPGPRVVAPVRQVAPRPPRAMPRCRSTRMRPHPARHRGTCGARGSGAAAGAKRASGRKRWRRQLCADLVAA